MCDPITIGIGVASAAVGGTIAASKAKRGQAAPVQADPEAERMKAEAEAAASANRKLAADQRRRREQQSLIARGAPQPSLGDEQASGDGVMTKPSAIGLMRRFGKGYTSPRESLISRGASGAGTGAAVGGFRGTASAPL